MPIHALVGPTAVVVDIYASPFLNRKMEITQPVFLFFKKKDFYTGFLGAVHNRPGPEKMLGTILDVTKMVMFGHHS
jgi:hypothetical protein